MASMLANGMSLAGLYCPVPGHVRKGVTLSMTTSFLGQASGGMLKAIGSICGGGRKSYNCSYLVP